MKKLSMNMRATLSAAAALAVAAAAQAGITDPGLVITASNANGSGVYQVFLSNGTFSTTNTPNDTWEWTSPLGGYDIFDNSFAVVAHVDFMHCKMVADPQITVNFQVDAGALTTHFNIASGVLSFGTLNPASGRATAGIGITDNDGDGALLTGGFPGVRAYHSDFNSGSTFANLVSPVLAAPFDSGNGSEDSLGYPVYLPMGAVSDISAAFDFDLSANDSAVGTSFYEVIPSPAVASVMGLAGLVGMSRRRR